MATIVSSGMTLSGITVDSTHELYCYSCGIAKNVTITSGGLLRVSGGGVNGVDIEGGTIHTVSANTVLKDVHLSHGSIYGSSGTTMVDPTQRGGRMWVYSGCIVNNLYREPRGRLSSAGYSGISDSVYLYGGTISGYICHTDNSKDIDPETGWLYRNWLEVASGSVLTDAVFTAGCSANVNGGVGCKTYRCINRSQFGDYGYSYGNINSSVYYIAKDLTENFTQANGTLYIGHGGDGKAHVRNFTINGGNIYVRSAGTYVEHTSQRAGHIYLSGGATMVDTVVGNSSSTYSSYIDVYSGGYMERTTITRNGNVTFHSGAEAHGVYVSGSSLICNVYGTLSGGTTMAGSAGNGNGIYVRSGGRAYDITVSSGGSCYCYGGYISGECLHSGGLGQVNSGGTIERMVIQPGATAYISSGAYMRDATISSGGLLRISSCGIANGGTVYGGGNIYCYGGTVTDFTNHNYIYMYSANPGGYASNIVYHILLVSANAYAANVRNVDDWTTLNVNGGTVLSASIDRPHCKINTFSNGSLTSATIYNGSLTITNATASEVVIHNGYAYISSGGVIDDVTIFSGGSMTVSSAGTALNVTSNAGASITVLTGGTITYR